MLPARYDPKFWADADGRCVTLKLIRQLYQELKNDSSVDCVQKDLICQRAGKHKLPRFRSLIFIE